LWWELEGWKRSLSGSSGGARGWAEYLRRSVERELLWEGVMLGLSVMMAQSVPAKQ
jgi:hypothetical protein